MKKWTIDFFIKYFAVFFPLIIVFLFSMYPPSDADLGWHLRYGEYFFKHGQILRQNIFSSSMPSYYWTNHSWASDILTFFVYNNLGFLGLTLLGALVIALTFYFFAKSAKLSFWEQAFLFPILLYLEEPLAIISFRSQLFTLLAAGILYFLMTQFEERRKYIFLFCLPLFFAWSNLHGGFILGLGILFIWIIVYLARKIYTHGLSFKEAVSDIKFLSLLFLGCFLITLINPFGIDIYKESLRHFGNPLQKYIIEWIPFEPFTLFWWQLVIWGGFLIINLIYLFLKKKLIENLPFVILSVIFYFLSLWMRRYAWLMFFISFPVVKNIFTRFKPRQNFLCYVLPTIIFATCYFYIIFVKNPFFQPLNMSWERYCQQFILCSPKSAELLKKQKFTGNFLSFYNWGGWLIWNYPEIKPSIDGRMPFWKDEKGYSAFEEYYPLEQNWKDVDKSRFDIIYITPYKPLFNRMTELVNAGKWKVVYQDDYASVFIRKKTSS